MATDGLIIDNFAGGGGASLGMEWALDRPVSVAINHDAEAIAMHRLNHPATVHVCEDVWHVNPAEIAAGRPVDLAWFSPDCKDFSKAKGGVPVSKKIRGLAGVAILWARQVRPRVIIVENVEEFQRWGPLVRSKPCPARRSMLFHRWIKRFRELGYRVEWRELRACEHGAPTIRKRLFVIARCDGLPIVWPEPTHGPGLLPFRTAAECIDWSVPCPSIFGRKRPLAENTMRRIARGVQRFVIDAAEPFIVRYQGRSDVAPIGEPLSTATARGKHGLVVPYFVPRHGERAGQDPRCRSVGEPMPTVTATANGASLVVAFLAQHNTGVVGHDMRKPVSTLTGACSHQQLVASHLVKFKGTCRDGQDLRRPMPTVQAEGKHIGEVRAFLIKYYGTAVGQSVAEPLHTTTDRARFGLVTVAGEPYQIVDIGMRMLTPRELFRAQGFPDSYRIDPVVNGKPLTKRAQYRNCGNSVPPPLARAVAAANMAAELTVSEAV